MDNPDILRVITTPLDNQVLEVLSLTPVWPLLTPFIDDQNWWHDRVEYLVHHTLSSRPQEDWRTAYNLLSTHGIQFDHREYYKSALILSILLEIGVDPTPHSAIIMDLSARAGQDLELMKLILSDRRIDPAAHDNIAIIIAARKNRLGVVRLLLEDSRADPAAQNNASLYLACREGHSEIVKLLLTDPRVDPSNNANVSIQTAVFQEHLEIVRLLLSDSRVDPSDEENEPIRTAARQGYYEMVELLLTDDRVDPTANDNEAIRMSAESGHIDVVRLLLADPNVDSTADDNYALHKAVTNNRVEVVKLLLADQRDLNEQDIDLYDIFWESIRTSSLEVIQLLLADERLNVSANSNYALRIARNRRRVDVEALLLSAIEKR